MAGPWNPSRALINSYPLLFAAQKEILDTDNLSKTILSAMLQTDIIPVDIIAKFWILFARSVSDQRLLFISAVVIHFVDKYDINYDVIDYVISKNISLNSNGFFWSTASSVAKKEKSIRYFHNLFTSGSKDDSSYFEFFSSNCDFIVNKCYLNSLNYLLFPDRGPGNFNLDTFVMFIMNSDKPEPLVSRICDWIISGLFDLKNSNDEGTKLGMPLYIFYNYLNRCIYEKGSDKFELVEKLIFERLFFDLRSIDSRESSRERFRIGISHVQTMLACGYGGIHHVQDDILSRVYENHFSREESTLMRYIKKGCQSLHHILVSSRDFSGSNFGYVNREMFDVIENYLETTMEDANQNDL